ncbi:MAG: antibiotic biosynthesis monooxygenase, partial [Pseudomonadota bacterium]|nr:antibiotic biosynthesis monooxygenase [Pseudomonadota bacterium]
MVFNNVLLRAKDPQRITEISELLRQQGSLSSEESGCERFDVYQSETEPELFLLIEAWASEGHLAQHRKADAFTQLYQPKVMPL